MVRFGVWKVCALAGALALALAAVTAPGTAAVGWKKPVNLGPRVSDLHLTDFSVGARGDAAIVWYSKQPKPPFAYRVRVAVRGNGHGWGRPVNLYAGNHGAALDGPHVVVNSGGMVTTLWAQGVDGSDTSHCSVRAAHGKMDAAWSLPKALSKECAKDTSLTVDGQGNLVGVWQSLDTGLAMYATKTGGQQWSAAAPVPHTSGLAVRGLATDEAGDSALVLAGDRQGKRGVYVARRQGASGWSKPVKISGVEPLGPAQVAESTKGDVTVMWSAARKHILTASSPAHGSWSKARRLGKGARSHLTYAGRRALAVWASPRGSTMFAMKPRRGGWRAVANLSGTSKRNKDQGLSSDGQGHVTVVWCNFFTGDILSSTRGKKGKWSAVQTVARKGYLTSPFIASTPAGQTWITWRDKHRHQKFRAQASRQR